MTCLAPSSIGSRSLFVLGVALAGALAMPAAARASSCTFYPVHVLPDETTASVPTNTRIWYAGQALIDVVGDDGSLVDCDVPPRLVDAAGLEVPTTTRAFSFAYVLVPDAPLELGAEYVVEHGCLYDRVSADGALDGETTRFTVTAEADDEPPAQPDVAIGETRSTEYENGYVGYYVPLEAEFEGILLVDIGAEATLDPDALAGEVSLASTDDDFVIGHACIDTWPEAEPGASTTLAFASFDLAGNFSGWTEPEPITVDEEGCQCRAGTGRTPVLAWGLVLLGAWARRRPRRRR